MVMESEETDSLGISHLRYRQFFKKVEVENMEFLVRAKNNWALSANGDLVPDFQPETTEPRISEEEAWRIVSARIPAERYYRDDAFIADFENDSTAKAGYRPKGKLIFTEDPASTAAERRLAWVFKVYVTPLDNSRQVYIHALEGGVIKEFPLFPSCFAASGPVNFRGIRNFNTQQKGERFYLTDDCNGNLLRASLLDSKSKNVDISDEDNNWVGNNPSVVTSLWGLWVCYDYFRLIHSRTGYDGKNANMTIYNDPNMRNNGHNATGGGGGIRIGLANAGNDNDDYNCLDVVGHEFMHNVIETSSKLTYDTTQESSALNESFCDIFGQMVEQWIEGAASKEWVIADDKGCTAPYLCRDLKNPKTYNQPDTYKGNFWQSPPNSIDPHTNGCVQNRWFALLTDGGAGTNSELGTQYSINGIGMVKARKIAWRTMTRYLTSTSNFKDARNGSIYAAKDLYGENSQEVGEVVKAWCAVGLCPYTVPRQPDRFDRPGGNPNPASPNNNNSVAGATPLNTWNFNLPGSKPRLNVRELSIFPYNDVDYFNIYMPAVEAPAGRCFRSAFTFNLNTEVNIRVFSDGALLQSHVNKSYFTVLLADIRSNNLLIEIKAAFPNQILDYNLQMTYFLRFDSKCYQTAPPNKLELIRECIMCDLNILSGRDQVILEPLYRKEDLVAPLDHYFYWRGGGAFEIPVNIIQGNNLHVELVNEAGEVVSAADRAGNSGRMFIQAPQLPEGVYSLQFSKFGNATEIEVITPQQ